MPNQESITQTTYFGKNLDTVNRKEFGLYYQGIPIFSKVFNPQNSLILDKESGVFKIRNHFFSNLERLIYKPKSTFEGVSAFPLGIGQTLNSVGVLTTKLPEEVYVIKLNTDEFKLSTRKDYAQSGIYVTFTDSGSGNAHELEMFKKNEKTIISVNDIIQYPLSYSSLEFNLFNNVGGQIGSGTTVFSLSGISSVNPKDLLKIEDEYIFINNVGLGTTSVGPITYSGDFFLVDGVRGAVGTSATSHTDGTSARIYRGSYNIVGNEINFSEPPRGSAYFIEDEDFSNLTRAKATFNGRVFLRKNYDKNEIYDDISERFNGLDTDYTLSIQGINTAGLGSDGGNGILLINGIFQTPTTETNPNNNFFIIEDLNAGISTVSFTGITTSTGDIQISSDDVNKNELPRGGLIVSLGSTSGLGYAPLVGASVTAVVSGGSIVSVGLGTTDILGSGYYNNVSVEVVESGHTGTTAVINAVVGAGGTLSFNIANGGSGYTSPRIIISPPSYDNLPIIGVSRLGIGQTTETGSSLLIGVEVGASSTSGIGSTTFEVKSFKIRRNGYGFRRGDVFKPVGLVTALGLESPINEFELTVVDVFNDSFALWNFGSLNFIDSVRNYQDGVRVRFPLFYNSQLLSFEKNSESAESQLIDMDSLLVIFINGVLQTPGESYQFPGGTSFTFTTAPKPEDKIDIFFYIGTENEDSVLVNVVETIKVGDTVELLGIQNPIVKPQTSRYILDVAGSDKLETSLYLGNGIDDVNYRPFNWIKQKRDLIINNAAVSKSRDSIEPQIYPTAKIIKNFSSSDSEIFVENIDLFKYDNKSVPANSFNLIIYDESMDKVSAAATAIISSSGQLQSLVISNPGKGYIGTEASVRLSRPYEYLQNGIFAINPGITSLSTSEDVRNAIESITASGTLSVSNGEIDVPANFTSLNVGSGYTYTNPPQVVIEPPQTYYELTSNSSSITGLDVGITSIRLVNGIGVSKAIEFTVDDQRLTELNNNGFSVGYPIYVYGTTVGNGITSIDSSDSDIIGISTVSVNNIYYVHAWNSVTGILTCNVLSTTSISGLPTSIQNNVGSGLTSRYYPVGRFSWGKISGITRTSSTPLSFNVKGNNLSGLSTYPTIQRRGYGLRSNGAIKKSII